MKRTPLKRIGKKGKAWNNTRRKLKTIFEQMGITFCEKCGSDFGLSFAHSKKRRFILDQSELEEVALLCIKCHSEIEVLPHSEMYSAISNIINKRANV